MAVRQPFVLLDPVTPTTWQRIMRRRPRENAAVEINNRIARAKQVREVTAADIQQICALHRVDVTRALDGRLERLYRDYLTYCLEDRHLSPDELADLAHLKTILRMDEESVAAIHEYVARQIYCKSVIEVLEDGVIDEEEREFLSNLQRALSLSVRAATKIVDAKRRQHARDN